jgi:Mor family transcriptional regulator
MTTETRGDLLGGVGEDLPAAAAALAAREEVWPARLTELTDLLADALARALPELAAPAVRRVAVQLVTRLCEELGGSQWYWPKKDVIARALRDLAIWAAHDGTRGEGRGIRGLARRHGLSENQVWSILRAQRAQHVRRVQRELPLNKAD